MSTNGTTAPGLCRCGHGSAYHDAKYSDPQCRLCPEDGEGGWRHPYTPADTTTSGQWSPEREQEIDLDRIRETAKVATAEAAELSTAGDNLPHGIAALVEDVTTLLAELDRTRAERNRYRNAWHNARTRAADGYGDADIAEQSRERWREATLKAEAKRDALAERVAVLAPAHEQLVAILHLVSGRPGYDTVTVKQVLGATLDSEGGAGQAAPDVEYGVRVPEGEDGPAAVLNPTEDRREAEARLDRPPGPPSATEGDARP